MGQSPEEKRAYQRGYQTGRNGRWPDYVPPRPEDPVWEQWHSAAMALRNAVDEVCATIDPEDVWVQRLGPCVDAMDAAETAFQIEERVRMVKAFNSFEF